MTRHQLREHIFLLVFRSFFFSYEDMPEQVRLYLENLEEPAGDADAEYIEKKSAALFKKLEELDGMLAEGLKDYAGPGPDSREDKEEEDDDRTVASLSSGGPLMSDRTHDGGRRKWSLDRLGKVERSILLLGLYEIKFDDEIPSGVAIDEAVEIAKKYGQDGAGSFVNGVLARFV